MTKQELTKITKDFIEHFKEIKWEGSYSTYYAKSDIANYLNDKYGFDVSKKDRGLSVNLFIKIDGEWKTIKFMPVKSGVSHNKSLTLAGTNFRAGESYNTNNYKGVKVREVK